MIFKDEGYDDKNKIEKTNLMLLGPTGSGKTYLVKKLAEMMKVPYYIADANNMTASGYVGKDVESVVDGLFQNARGNFDAAATGIVFIDEFDKICSKSDGGGNKRKDVGGEAVQQALLKLIEGCEIEMERMQGLSKVRFVVDTSNILFIVGGAFTGLDEIIQKRLGEDKRSIGFGANFKEAESLVNIFNKVQPEDLEEYGFIPEILGRIPTIAPLQELTKDNLIDILTKVKNNLMDQYSRLFAYSDLELKISKKGLEHIAEKAIERKVGARGLKSLIEMVLLEYMFNLESAVLDEKDVKKIIDEVQT